MNSSFDSVNSWRLLDAATESRGLFLFKFKDYQAAFRALSVAEIESIHKLNEKLNDTFIEDWIIQRTLVACTKGLDYMKGKVKAGHIKHIAETIMVKSAITNESDLYSHIAVEREASNSTKNIVESLILGHFPSVTLSTLRGLSLKDQISLVCKAERVLDKELLALPDSEKTRPANNSTSWLTSENAADTPDFFSDGRD